jgi:hypothetical protein
MAEKDEEQISFEANEYAILYTPEETIKAFFARATSTQRGARRGVLRGAQARLIPAK